MCSSALFPSHDRRAAGAIMIQEFEIVGDTARKVLLDIVSAFDLSKIANTRTVQATLKENEIKFRVKTSLNAREQVLAADQLGDIEIAASKWSLTTNLVPSGQTWYITAIYTTKRK